MVLDIAADFLVSPVGSDGKFIRGSGVYFQK
jgi:hypothetical protein